MSVGKQVRLHRFFYPRTPYGLIVPIDHGLTMGPLSGISHIKEISSWISHPSVTGIIAHKGIVERLGQEGALTGKGIMVHLNGMSNLSNRSDDKVLLTSLESAMLLAADGVSVQVNFDGKNDKENLQLLGKVVDEAHRAAMPVLAMVYDKVQGDTAQSRLAHLIRITIELGCDAIKIGAPADLAETLTPAAQDIPIFVAGGALADDRAILNLAKETVRCGGAGLCVGRNIF